MKKLLILVALLLWPTGVTATTMSSYYNCGGELLTLKAYDEDENDVWERFEYRVDGTVFATLFYQNDTGEVIYVDVMGEKWDFFDLVARFPTPCDLLKGLDLKAI